MTTSSRQFGVVGGVVVTALAVVITAMRPSSARIPQYMPYQGEPPYELSQYPEVFQLISFLDGDLRGEATYSTTDKSVTVWWWIESASLQNPGARLKQVFATSFWPTALWGDGERLVVAGKRKNGNTVMEVWSFDEPELLEAPPQQFGDPPRPDYEILPTTIASIETVYDQAVEGRDMIDLIVRAAGNREHILAHFWDSGDLYVFDLSQPTVSPVLIASPQAGQGVYAEPALDHTYNNLWCADNVIHGYIYAFCDELGAAPIPGGRCLILEDTDQDGVIDGSFYPDEMQWLTELAGASAYTPLPN